jgi:hypothetical protein
MSTIICKGTLAAKHLGMPTSADYNAFGYDPEGFLAHLAAHTYGPNWRPHYNVQQFVGPPEPPRYGAPAPYQIPHLPTDFRPRSPPLYYGRPYSPYLEPPQRFNRHNWDALMFARRIRRMLAREWPN